MKELLEAKKALYSLLLKKPDTELTEVESDLMYVLSLDGQIQAMLKENSTHVKKEAI